MRADNRLKTIYAYVGGSGKKLNQEMIGTNFIRTIVDCGYRVASNATFMKCQRTGFQRCVANFC